MTITEKNEAQWVPIEPLSPVDLAIDVSEFDSMARVWEDARGKLEKEGSDALREFNERLRRSWSIETGILENLYVVDRGTTQTLIDRGFHQELIDRAGTDTDPGRLVAILKDHLAAGDMVHGLIEEGRPLTPHFIRELHAALTQHQEWVEAIDSLGNEVKAEPIKGQWKNQPNYRDLPSGTRFFYCPPEQVEGQIEEMLTYLVLHEEDQTNVCILAAWLHHRFTYLHPFQDVNGRVARALVNYLFVKAGLFPVVVDRGQKSEYISALEAADAGDLKPLVGLFAAKQIEAIKQALSLAGVGERLAPDPLVREIARGVVQRVRHREAQKEAQFKEVDNVIEDLAEFAVQLTRDQLAEFQQELREGGLESTVDVDYGGTYDDRAHYYRWQIIESAKQTNKWANFSEDARWVRALVRGGTSQLRVVFSFHHVGRVLTGVAEVTSIADLEDLKADSKEMASQTTRTPVYCMLQPFSLTWRDKPEALRERFADWSKNSFVMALRAWAETQ